MCAVVMRYDAALAAEFRPHATGSRVSSVIVELDDRYTVASTGDWELAQAMQRANLELRGVA